ncbi:flagellar hook-associated 2 domain-containing protein [Desulfovibrio sp. X2]|uniref:flagellar filament capping protein FliD n=1 Tax=Desulfovibrio sp. X2 TaxID=941449 RepID=UPI000358AC65|nr:flagellar filament capping protein FliD [Desulfovibrio sp. X2]EPR44364.1 flagellar hook-associated 2 domain-containing protein [Desulfovibrio sp. X2]
MVNDTLTSGGIHFTGLGSNTDFDSIIDKLIQVESAHKNQLTEWQATWQQKQAGFQDLNTKLLTLQTTLQGMDRESEFLLKNADSSNPDDLTATASADAQEGSYVFTINQLAKTQIVTMTGTSASSLDAKVNATGSAQTFSYNYQGTEHSISVPDGTTFSTLISMINNDGANPGVRASSIKISDGVYQLQLRGLDTGATNTLLVSSNTTLTGYTASNATVTQTAQDAQFRLDGFPSNAWLSRSTNTIDDVVNGLSVLLKATSAGSDVTVSVSTDTAAIKQQIHSFVDQMNDVRAFILSLTKFDAQQKKGSLLTGNYGVEMVSSNLKNIVASKGIGFNYYNSTTGQGDVYTTLSQLGILTEADPGSPNAGLLTVDDAALDTALQNNPDAVAELFSGYYDGSTTVSQPASNAAAFSYASSIAGSTQGGTYNVSYTVAGGSVTGATIDGYAATYDSNTHQLTASKGPAGGLAISVNSLVDGSYSGTVSLKVGKATELIDQIKQLTNSTDGTLHILEDNYQDIIDDIQTKIDYENNRLSDKRRALTDQFARLEKTLSNYNGIQSALNNGISQMSSSSSSSSSG